MITGSKEGLGHLGRFTSAASAHLNSHLQALTETAGRHLLDIGQNTSVQRMQPPVTVQGMNSTIVGTSTQMADEQDCHSTITCYTDASISPDGPNTQPRFAGIGIVFVNMQGDPGNKLFIKAIIKDASSVIMAEAGALALAARIAVSMGYTNVSFFSDSSQLVQFLSTHDHSHSPDWRMKNFTQEYDNSTASIQSNLYKINRAENLVADSLARNALPLASTVHQPFSLDCSFRAHESQCPMFQALKSVTTTMHSVWLLAASCC